jgi:nitrogen regulatory protein PII
MSSTRLKVVTECPHRTAPVPSQSGQLSRRLGWRQNPAFPAAFDQARLVVIELRIRPARRGAGRSNRRVPIFFRRLFVKQVIAVVKPYLVERVLENLKHAPLEACCVSEAKGYGRQKSYLDEYKGSEYSAAFLPKVEIALWVDDLRVDEVVRTIVEVARTGRMGDGKIFVLPSGIPGGREIDLA